MPVTEKFPVAGDRLYVCPWPTQSPASLVIDSDTWAAAAATVSGVSSAVV